MKFSQLKKEAFTLIKENYFLLVAMNVIFSLLSLGVRYVSNVTGGVLSLLIALFIVIFTVPFSYGIIVCTIKAMKGLQIGIIEFIKVGLNNFKRSWKVAFAVFLKSLLPIILIIISFLAFSVSATLTGTSADKMISGAFALISFILVIASFIYYFIKVISLSMAEYLSVINQEKTANECAEESMELMNGNKWKLVLLVLSFILWFILIAILSFILGIILPSSVYSVVSFILSSILSPYITATEILFFEKIS